MRLPTIILFTLALVQLTWITEARARLYTDGHFVMKTCVRTGNTFNDECIMYVRGLYDGLNVANFCATHLEGQPVYCTFKAEKQVTADQLTHIFLNYLNSHPNDLGLFSWDLFLEALKEAFPCR